MSAAIVQSIVLKKGVETLTVDPKTKRCKVTLKGSGHAFVGSLKDAIEWIDRMREYATYGNGKARP